MSKVYTIQRLSPCYQPDKGFSILDPSDRMKEVANLIRYEKDGQIVWEPCLMGPFSQKDFERVWQPLAEVLTTTGATHASIPVGE